VQVDLGRIRWRARLLSVDGRVVGAGALLGTRHVLTSAQPLVPLGGPDAELLVDLVDLPDAAPLRARVARDGWCLSPDRRASDVALLELEHPQQAGIGAELHHVMPGAMRDVRVFGCPPNADAGVWVDATAAGGGELVQLASRRITSGFAGGPVLDGQTGQLLGIVTVRSAGDHYMAWLLPADTIMRCLPRLMPSVLAEAPIVTRLDRLVVRAGRQPGHRYDELFVSLPEGTTRAPADALIARPDVPERARFCVNVTCRAAVGRSLANQPARDQGVCARCGTPFDFTPPLDPGDVVADRYEVMGYLARGGFGWLFLATDRANGDTVVLKSMSGNGDHVLAVAETRILSMLDDPGVVRVLDFVPHENRESGRGTGFLVMEYVSGRSLRDVLRAAATGVRYDISEPPLRAEQVAAYGAEILSIVARLHQRGVLHCDIKPDNVIQSGHRLKLIDLGAARLISDRTSPVIGTRGYQVSEEELATYGPTVRADIHAVGRTLQQLLRATGGYLNGDTRTESLKRLIDRAMGPYKERFATADEMRDQLTGVLREILSLRDGIPRPVTSALFSAMPAPLDGGLGDIPEVGKTRVIACPPPAELAAALPAVLESADAMLRTDWLAGVKALATDAVTDACPVNSRPRWRWRSAPSSSARCRTPSRTSRRCGCGTRT
jgi:hypothetical protein